jgi:hypothetical protein
MSYEMEQWACQVLKNITGTDDITLCHYLMTIESPSQCAEYVHELLGSLGKTAKVDNFLEGFLERKNNLGGDDQGEDSEAKKKARRRRGGGKKKGPGL